MNGQPWLLSNRNVMRRFFIDPAKISGDTAVIDGPEARHLIKVLRLKAGEQVILFDGTGMIYTARVEGLVKNQVTVAILSAIPNDVESRPALYLGQALAKGKKMDFIIQKATELGVAGIRPFVSEHCVDRGLDAKREQRRVERWQRIALEACKQCDRPTPPVCLPPADFTTLVRESVDCDQKFIFWEAETTLGLKDVFTGNQATGATGPVMMLIGPEGGFSREEVAEACTAGFQPVSLGRRILRTETAAVATIAILQYILGNLEP